MENNKMRECENDVTIEGILSEISISETSYMKDNQKVEALGGVLKIRVPNKDGSINDIPVHMFSNKYKKDGTPNSIYKSIETIKNTYVSIAACGNEEQADKIRVSSGKIQMNEFTSQSGKAVSFPRITCNFVNRVKPEEYKPQAVFSVEFVIGRAGYETTKDGLETDRYKIEGVVVGYNGRVDLVPFYTSNQNVTDVVSQYWSEGDTVKASGRLNFSSKTETYTKPVDFGEPIEETRTINISELLITGGSQTPLDGSLAYDMEDIKNGLKERKARLEAAKEKNMSGVKNRTAPAVNKSSTFDLGF